MIAWLAAAAEAAQVQLVVEPSHLVQGQTGSVRLMIVLEGREHYDSRRAPPLPTGSGLRAAYVGQSSNTVQRINLGQMTRVLQYQYSLLAGAAGEWTVGPVELALPDGSVLKAEPVKVVVTERPADQAAETSVSAALHSDRPAGDGGAPRAWEGQVVTYERQVQSRLPQTRVSWSDPNLEGLRPVHLGTPEERRFRIDDPQGPVDVIRAVYPLVATGLGHHDLGAAVATLQVPARNGGSFFGLRTEVLMSDPVTLDVDALPPAPPGFGGLVGDFELTSRLTQTQVVSGQSVPWTLVLSGDGSLEGVTLPPFSAPGLAVYDSDPRIEARVEGEGYVSSATFSRVLVPTEVGEVELPDLDLVVFSPSKGEYEHLTVDLPKLVVNQGKEGDGAVTTFGHAPTEVEGDPSVPRPPWSSGRASAPSLRPFLVPALVLALAPGLGVLLQDLGTRWLARRRARAALAERPPGAAELLAALPDDPAERLAVLDHVLRLCEPRATDATELRELRKRLGKVRFGGGQGDDTLEADIRRVALRLEREAA